MAIYLTRLDFNPSDQTATLPVKHANSTLAFDTEQSPSAQTFCLETNIERAALLKFLEKFDACTGFSNGIICRVLM
jgi:hypothetical protein